MPSLGSHVGTDHLKHRCSHDKTIKLQQLFLFLLSLPDMGETAEGVEAGEKYVSIPQLAGVGTLLSNGGKVRLIIVFDSPDLQLSLCSVVLNKYSLIFLWIYYLASKHDLNIANKHQYIEVLQGLAVLFHDQIWDLCLSIKLLTWHSFSKLVSVLKLHTMQYCKNMFAFGFRKRRISCLLNLSLCIKNRKYLCRPLKGRESASSSRLTGAGHAGTLPQSCSKSTGNSGILARIWR